MGLAVRHQQDRLTSRQRARLHELRHEIGANVTYWTLSSGISSSLNCGSLRNVSSVNPERPNPTGQHGGPIMLASYSGSTALRPVVLSGWAVTSSGSRRRPRGRCD